MKNKRKNKGFTLAELLIVVAIIAVLVAISIPIFSALLEKSRESTDFANVRAAYAEVMASAISQGDELKQADGTYRALIKLNQAKDGWDTEIDNIAIGGVGSADWKNTPKAKGTCAVTFDPSTGKTEIDWDYTGGDSGTEPTQSDINDAIAQNDGLANGIFGVVEDMLNINYGSDVHNSTKVTISVNQNGEVSITVNSGQSTSLTESKIRDALISKNILNADGTADFNTLDPRYPKGYNFMCVDNGNNGNKINIHANN